MEERDPNTGIVLGTEAITLQPRIENPQLEDTACLLVHGFVASHNTFNDLGELLSNQGFTVRLMRLPGHGTTPRDFARQTPETLYNAVLEEFLALKQNFSRVHVIGFSMGATLSSLLAAEHPVDRLVLLAPYYRIRYYWYHVLPVEFWNTLLGPIIPYVKKPKNCFPQIRDSSQRQYIYSYRVAPTAGARIAMRLASRACQKKLLSNIQCPALMISSLNDRTVSPRAARKAFKRLGSPQKEFLEVENSYHLLLWDYDQEEVKKKIIEFLLK